VLNLLSDLPELDCLIIVPRGYGVSHLQKFCDLGHNALVLRGATFAALQLAGGFEARPHHITVCSEKNGV